MVTYTTPINCLIISGLGFQVSPEAKALLQSIGSERVGVIAVAGKYRTGKSFLLNRILLE
jgi:hypothetical protein